MTEGFYQEALQALQDETITQKAFDKLKMRLSKKHGLRAIPSDIQLMLHADAQTRKQVKHVSKPVRSQSGVTVIAIMSAPFACQHGKCIYCPGGPGSVFGTVPQSYTGKEPSTMRGIRNNYDSYLQVFNRLEQYIATGHVPDKIELIIMGGTFPSFPLIYQENFMIYAYKAMNDFSELFFPDNILDFERYKQFFEMPGNLKDNERTQRIQERERALRGESTLAVEQQRNETTKIRCVALCLETRPDYAREPDINRMLSYGATRVEIGVQSVYENVVKGLNRCHTVQDSIHATQLMKDSLLKVGYHMMPGLPWTTKEQDIAGFKELFTNPDFMPDALKIYPCLVFPGTELYEMWKGGEYKPLSIEQAAERIVKIKQFIPKWCRIMRVQRDIPSYLAVDGAKRTNLRQIIEELKHQQGITCNCIRCREPKNTLIEWNHVRINTETYKASKGTEVFISADDMKNNKLLGFCRLRIIAQPFRPEIPHQSAGIRELHVYGTTTAIGESGENLQHKGLGTQLMQTAEKIAREEYNCKKMLVISGVGVRAYYHHKLNYVQDGAYMSKQLSS